MTDHKRSDPFDPEKRSTIMSHIGGKNTTPELKVRRLLHRLGYRFRLHRKDLPGTPDIVFPSRRKVIWVHGCFWHRHQGCSRGSLPATRREFWETKLNANVRRDLADQERLKALGWRYLVVWQCELRSMDTLADKLQMFLDESTE